MLVSNGWRFVFCTWPSAEPIFCQLSYFPLILLSEHYFDKGLSNTQKQRKVLTNEALLPPPPQSTVPSTGPCALQPQETAQGPPALHSTHRSLCL